MLSVLLKTVLLNMTNYFKGIKEVCKLSIKIVKILKSKGRNHLLKASANNIDMIKIQNRAHCKGLLKIYRMLQNRI